VFPAADTGAGACTVDPGARLRALQADVAAAAAVKVQVERVLQSLLDLEAGLVNTGESVEVGVCVCVYVCV
jgi:hypothetical protein